MNIYDLNPVNRIKPNWNNGQMFARRKTTNQYALYMLSVKNKSIFKFTSLSLIWKLITPKS